MALRSVQGLADVGTQKTDLDAGGSQFATVLCATAEFDVFMQMMREVAAEAQ